MGEFDNMEELVGGDNLNIDFSESAPNVVINNSKDEEKPKVKKQVSTNNENVLINCLRKERVIVEFVPSEKGLFSDSKHVMYGGMHTQSKRRFVVPQLESGIYKNVLTNSEKDFLEYIMNLEDNALSIYKKVDNYWSNRYVELTKEPTILDLSVPDDYIKYKILLANDLIIASSPEKLRTNRKATYQFVISVEGESLELAVESLTTTARAYKLFGSLQDDIKKLALVIENTTGRMISKIDRNFVYAQVEKTISENPEKFIKSAEDPYLDTKILIKDSIDAGFIRKRGEFYFFTENNAPICNERQEPTLHSACEFLNAPKNQEQLFYLQSKVYNKD